MQDHIPDALITAFERQYDSSWNDPQLRKERLAMRYGWAAAMEAKQCLHQIQEPAPVLVAPAAVAVPDEREALNRLEAACDMRAQLTTPEAYKAIAECKGMIDALEELDEARRQARAALAVTPAAMDFAEAYEGARGDLSIWKRRALEAERDLRAERQTTSRLVAEVNAMNGPIHLGEAAAPVVLPEPFLYSFEEQVAPIVGSEQKIARTTYTKFKPSIEHTAYYTEQQVRALLATGGQAQAVRRGEVLVTVSGFTGSGKSAIAGEIEILCRALGLQVEWPDGESEKNMTHADWTAALEQYKPRVRIVEQNIPFVSKKGLSK